MIIPIDITKKYGILLSGGLDSAILLYLLLQQHPNLNIQPFTIPKFDGSIIYVNPIIEYINKKFNTNVPETILVGDPKVHHRLQSTIAITEIFEKYRIDFIFNALNKNPPELETYPGAPIRDTKSTNSKIILPFVDMYKNQILSLIYDQKLINLTHSCTERQIGRCGICWQCTERKWAFSKLGLEDTGIK